MTVKIHIPTSDPPEERPHGAARQPSPGPVALVTAGVVVVSMMVVLVVSVVSGAQAPESSVPAPFESSESAPIAMVRSDEWTERVLPGEGEVIALGTVVDTPVAVVRSWSETAVWQLVDGTWQLAGTPQLATVENAVVMDDRVLLVAPLEDRPTVWEWIDGSVQYLFQPTAGFVVGAWSVGGRLAVSVASTTPGVEQTIRNGRQDSLWLESPEGEFEELDLLDLESVFVVGGDSGLITVGGRDVDGRAAVGFVHGHRVLTNPVPGTAVPAAVTHLGGEPASAVARITVADRRRGTYDEIRYAGQDWALVTRQDDLVGVEVVDGTLVGVGPDGTVVRFQLDGAELPAPPEPPWSYGFVLGLAVIDGEPVAFGQSSTGTPMFVGPNAGSAEVGMPSGRWKRYHTEALDGFRLFHVGPPEFAIRETELFYRSWNGDRWHPTRGEFALYGVPRIVELDWGFVLIPPAGGGVWFSVDGSVWEQIEDTDSVRIEEVAANGAVLVGMTHYGALGGPTSDVIVLDETREPNRFSLPNYVVGLTWEDGVGFVGSVVPPGSGYVTSPDGLEWTRHDGAERFDWVVAFDGGLYLGTGDSVIEGEPPAETPGGPGWLFLLGETPAYQDGTGAMWLHTGDDWVDAGFGVAGGLPSRPETVIVRGPKMFAMVVGVDGVAETYVLELD